MSEVGIWGIHTKNSDLFLNMDKPVIAIGWGKMGDLSGLDCNKDKYKEKYAQVYPDATKNSIAASVGSLLRFTAEVKVGDYVVFPSKEDRKINIGQVVGDYYYDENEYDYKQKRAVKWLKQLPRTAFTQGALYEIGAFTSIFAIKNYANEFLAALNKKMPTVQNDETIERTAEDIIDTTRDFVLKELSKKLKGYDLENFVAALLEAMGYVPKEISPHGGDHGIDIVVYKDELPPRILVQVKSQNGDITESVVSSLGGVMENGDYGLFVTLSNFTKNAVAYLKKHPNIKGINGTELADLILKYYDGLDEKYKKIIPLKKVFIPVIDKSEQ